MADEYNRAVGGGTNCNWWDPSPTRRTTSSVIDSAATDPHSLQMIGLGHSSHQPIHHHWNSTRDDGDDDDQIISGGFRSLVQERTPFLPAAEPSPEFNSIRGSPAATAFSHSSSSVDSSSHGGGLPSPTFLTPLDSASGFFQGLIASSPMSDHQSGFGYNQAAGGYGMPSSCNSDNLMGWTQFLKPNSMVEAKPIQPQLMNINSHGSFWNAAAAAMADPRPAAFFPVAPPLLQPPQMAVPSFNEKRKNNMMEVRSTSGVGRKSNSGSNRTSTTATTSTTSTGSGTIAKRSRNEASSAALPPFKVRKEKMGDRITALQQLVSPFGKTDTASVLSEAIEYIKFLHEQVNVLSTPYLKSGASLQHQQSGHGEFKDQDQGARHDLRSRGLCLVPVSSTFPVAHETTVDFWTPTLGPPGAFR